MKNHLNTTFVRLQNKPKMNFNRGYRKLTDTDLYQQVVGFNCIVCHLPVNSDPNYSGVNNRNHCPYCLASKHVDLFSAGDRLCACKAPMKAIGLAWKKTKNKYGSKHGELMIVHQCEDCHEISINRIASDDDVDRLNDLFIKTINIGTMTKEKYRKIGILLLESEDKKEFIQSLLGKN